MRVRLLAPARAWEALLPLRAAWEARGWEVECEEPDGPAASADQLARVVEQADAVLSVGERRVAPRQALPGVALRRADGALVPCGWLPDQGPEALRTFAAAAAAVHARRGPSRGLAVLAQWSPRYLHLAGRVIAGARATGEPVWTWTSDLIGREEMAVGLRSGLGAAIYLGHGRPIGWVGYRGARLQHLVEPGGEPLGALLQLCCLAASRWRCGTSFAEAVVLSGVAASSLGSCIRTLHTDSTRWAVALTEALAGRPSSVGDWVRAAIPVHEAAAASWRLLGDPTAPLLDAAGARERAAQVRIWP